MAAVAPSCCSCSTRFASASSIPYRITSPSSSSPSRASPRLAPCRIRTPCLPELRRPPKCGRRTLGPMDRMECVEDKLVGGEVELADKNKNVAFDSSMGLAFAALAGMLVFQGSLQALASTELATLQPTDIVGDLGDINTGLFADLLL